MREFASPLDFSLHLLELSHRIEKIEETALEKCAVLIEKDAKSQIGFYQQEVGPFQNWAELADSTEADKVRKGYETDAPLLRQGDLRDSIEHEVVGKEAVIGSKSDIAEYQEFGTPTIPPRPFIGPAAFRNKDKIQKILGNAILEGITGGEAIHAALGYDMDIKP